GRSLRRQRIVSAVPAAAADRVDRREVDDVEAELGEPRQDLLDAGEAAEGAREELVPGAEARELAARLELERLLEARRLVVVGGLRSEGRLDVERRDAEDLLALGELAREVL